MFCLANDGLSGESRPTGYPCESLSATLALECPTDETHSRHAASTSTGPTGDLIELIALAQSPTEGRFIGLERDQRREDYSERSAWITSTRAARAAGSIDATTATVSNTNAEAATGKAPGIFTSPK